MIELIGLLIAGALFVAMGTVLLAIITLVSVYAAWWVLVVITVAGSYAAARIAWHPRRTLRDPEFALWVFIVTVVAPWFLAGWTTFPEAYATVGSLFLRMVTR